MDFIFDTLYNLQLIFNSLCVIVFMTFVSSYKSTISKLEISKFFKIFLMVFFSFMSIYGILGVVYEAKKNIQGHNIKNFSLKPNIVKDSLDNLVIVAQGIALSPHEDIIPKGMTNVDVFKLRDITGLGLITDSLFKKRTQVMVYSATHNLDLAPAEIITSVLYFRKLNPNGRIIFVGHSVGGYDLVKVSEKLIEYDINVDLLITMDNSNIEEYSVDLTIPKNVKKTINFKTIPKGGLTQNIMSGGIVKPGSKSNEFINVTLPKCTHTNVDNTMAKPIIQILKKYIDDSVNPFTTVMNMKKIRIYPNVNLFHTKDGLTTQNPVPF